MSTNTIVLSVTVGAGAALALLGFLLAARRRRIAKGVSMADLKQWFRRKG
ncbi:Uncharacterised protein [Amycolatopsis camponoti]|uniref:Uncharacterized protein n=1 Tax=Amycolatopsis camponoti TaxID=2606593 RepID=A0A6I8M9W3_9PSEU|nr:Uncharacterised protein [Amycolatopsis camponoti]